MKRNNTKLAAIVASIAVIVTGFGAVAQPASAAFNTYLWGSPGPWLPTSDWTTCYPGLSGYISTLSPRTGRATSYTSSIQTIYMLSTLERFNLSTRAWEPYLQAPAWQKVTTSPGQYAKFVAQSYSNLPHGSYYRAGYRFQWFVGNTKIGEAMTYNTRDEYYQRPTWDFPYDTGDFCFA